MFPELIRTYLIAITLLTITPGMDALLVLRNTGRGGLGRGHGRKARDYLSRVSATNPKKREAAASLSDV